MTEGGWRGTRIGFSEVRWDDRTHVTQLTISCNIPQILPSPTRSRRVHTGVDGAALYSFLTEENDGEDILACNIGGAMAMLATLEIPEPAAGDMTPEPRYRHQAMDSSEWEAWREAEETEICGMTKNGVYEEVGKPKDKLMVGYKTVGF